jgi:hypothetical protein
MLDPARSSGDGPDNTFRPLEPACQVVQFSQPLPPVLLERAGALMADRPNVQLYVYGRAAVDLEFLRHFRELRRLHVALYELEDITGFAHVARSLEELNFGRTKKTFSLRFVEKMGRLDKLFLVGHKKDIAAIRTRAGMTRLGLSGITLPDLSLLLGFDRLRELSIFLGGTRDLRLLARLPALEHLFLMRITNLSDLSVLGALEGLQWLRLDWMRNVASLPSFAPLTRLETVFLDTMRGLTDLSPVAAAPCLRYLSVVSMAQLTAESFRCFLGHPSLAELHAYVGKSGANEAVKRMFPGIAR